MEEATVVVAAATAGTCCCWVWDAAGGLARSKADGQPLLLCFLVIARSLSPTCAAFTGPTGPTQSRLVLDAGKPRI